MRNEGKVWIGSFFLVFNDQSVVLKKLKCFLQRMLVFGLWVPSILS